MEHAVALSLLQRVFMIEHSERRIPKIPSVAEVSMNHHVHDVAAVVLIGNQ